MRFEKGPWKWDYLTQLKKKFTVLKLYFSSDFVFQAVFFSLTFFSISIIDVLLCSDCFSGRTKSWKDYQWFVNAFVGRGEHKRNDLKASHL